MARVSWNNIGERRYEAGLDRGMLYVPAQIGVAWSGLISVAEDSSGGEAKAYYLDGVKYANISSTEEYEGVLTAYTYPDQFGVCDGSATIQNGLFATRQPRLSFGLSYRTIIGNDLAGVDHGYRVNLVYNVLASPTQRTHRTFSDNGETTLFSWNLSSKPPSITGYKRTAHFVIDSRTTNPEVLSELEDLLYGTESEDPALPTVAELIAIFTP